MRGVLAICAARVGVGEACEHDGYGAHEQQHALNKHESDDDFRTAAGADGHYHGSRHEKKHLQSVGNGSDYLPLESKALFKQRGDCLANAAPLKLKHCNGLAVAPLNKIYVSAVMLGALKVWVSVAPPIAVFIIVRGGAVYVYLAPCPILA